MRRVFPFAVCILLTLGTYAQRYACVNTEYILSNMPEYANAQQEIEDLSIQWQKEVEAKFRIVDKMYKAFQAESVLLPDELKAKKENEIITAEKEAKEIQKQRFGNNGDLVKKRAELIKPIQDKIYNAIEKVAQEKNYQFVFDKSAGATILYVDAKADISDQILKDLGYKSSPNKR